MTAYYKKNNNMKDINKLFMKRMAVLLAIFIALPITPIIACVLYAWVY